eukprot:2785868-Amphidinium_carterae.2
MFLCMWGLYGLNAKTTNGGSSTHAMKRAKVSQQEFNKKQIAKDKRLMMWSENIRTVEQQCCFSWSSASRST